MSSDRAEIRAANRQPRRDRARLDNAVKAMLTQPDTRFYLNWLLEISKLGANPFTNNALTTAFTCGELNVGQQIFAHILEVDTAGYVRMRQEIEDERRNRNNAYNDDRDAPDDDTEQPFNTY